MSDKILTYARECLGTPFVHQGRQIGLGMDCAGLIVYVMQRLGLNYIDGKGYPRNPYEGMLENILDGQPKVKKIPITEKKPGDILLFRIKRDPQHLAIYAGKTIIHCYSQSGKVVEHSIGGWERKIVAVYRVVL